MHGASEKKGLQLFEIAFGGVLAAISASFVFLIVYFFIISIKNNKFGYELLLIELPLSFIALSIGVIAHRLIKQRGIKGSGALMSYKTLYVWSAIFFIGGLVGAVKVLLYGDYNFIISCIAMSALGFYGFKLANERRVKNLP